MGIEEFLSSRNSSYVRLNEMTGNNHLIVDETIINILVEIHNWDAE